MSGLSLNVGNGEVDWPEENEDRNVEFSGRGLKSRVVDRRGRQRERSVVSRSHSRSKSRSRSRVRSRSKSPKLLPSSVEQAIDKKLDGFLSKVAVMMQSQDSKPESLEAKVKELKLSQRELERHQKANKLHSEGGRFQFLSFSKVRGKLESMEGVLLEAAAEPEKFSYDALQSVLGDIKEAKLMIDHRLDFIARADGSPNGWKVLSHFEKMVENAPGKDPEREKLWSEAVRAVDREKKARITVSSQKKDFRGPGFKKGLKS
jgi:hypothetical protein